MTQKQLTLEDVRKANDRLKKGRTFSRRDIRTSVEIPDVRIDSKRMKTVWKSVLSTVGI